MSEPGKPMQGICIGWSVHLFALAIFAAAFVFVHEAHATSRNITLVTIMPGSTIPTSYSSIDSPNIELDPDISVLFNTSTLAGSVGACIGPARFGTYDQLGQSTIRLYSVP